MSWNQNGVLKDSEVWGILKEMLPQAEEREMEKKLEE